MFTRNASTIEVCLFLSITRFEGVVERVGESALRSPCPQIAHYDKKRHPDVLLLRDSIASLSRQVGIHSGFEFYPNSIGAHDDRLRYP